MFNVEKMLNRLTDNYSKRPRSNIGKLMQLVAEELRALGSTLERVEHWRNIDQAEGATLDAIGGLVAQPRGVATDEVYRIILRSKIARNLSTGDLNTIVTVLAVALDVPYTDIAIQEMHVDTDAPEPAAIKVVQLPLQKVNEAGMSPLQFAAIVQRTVSAGVRVATVELAGTFEFAAGAEDYDANKGFADLAQTTGGTLGYVYVPSADQPLPI